MFALIAASTQLLALLLTATVACDVVHALLHAAQHTRVKPLLWAASLHQCHHDFLDRALQFHDTRLWKNLACHQLPELGMRCLILSGASALMGVSPAVTAAALSWCLIEFVLIVAARGRDLFHPTARPLKAPRSSIFVDDAYHGLHHAFPDHFLSAHVQVLDRLFGRLLPLRGRNVVVVGGSAYCGALARALTDDGARVARVDASDVSDEALRDADIVVCGHGAGARGDFAYEVLLTRAQRLHGERPLPLEVWTVGDDDAWDARWPLLVDERTTLRRLSRGPQLGAKTTLALLKRGRRRV